MFQYTSYTGYYEQCSSVFLYWQWDLTLSLADSKAIFRALTISSWRTAKASSYATTNAILVFRFESVSAILVASVCKQIGLAIVE